jgi:DNA replication protein DnaC
MTDPERMTDEIAEVAARAAARSFEVIDDARLEELEQERRAEEKAERCRQLAETLIPAKFQEDIELLHEVNLWIADFWSAESRPTEWYRGQNGLTLIGPPGCGKTHTAYQIVRRLLVEFSFNDIQIHRATELFDEFTSRSRSGRSDRDLIRALGSVELLILDDLGAKKLTEFREERLLEVLDVRYEKQKSTIVTTNISGENFTEYFGGRVASRLGGMTRTVYFPAHDFRRNLDYGKGPAS